MAELKPCPFCKSKQVYEEIFTKGLWGSPWLWNVKCTCCYAEGPICDTKEQAIDAWNKRSK